MFESDFQARNNGLYSIRKPICLGAYYFAGSAMWIIYAAAWKRIWLKSLFGYYVQQSSFRQTGSVIIEIMNRFVLTTAVFIIVLSHVVKYLYYCLIQLLDFPYLRQKLGVKLNVKESTWMSWMCNEVLLNKIYSYKSWLYY